MNNLHRCWFAGLAFAMCSNCFLVADSPTDTDAPRPRVTDPSQSDRALMQSALLAGALGGADAALRVFDDVLARNPDCVEALKLRATLRTMKRDHSGAIADLEQVILRIPSDPDPYLMCAMFLWHEGKWEKALGMYDRLIAIDPRNVDAFTHRGALLLRKGHHERAGKDLERALKLNPKSADALSARGTLHAANGRFAEALADFRSALSSSPDHVETLIALARIHSRCLDASIRDGKKAVEYGKKAVEQGQHANYWSFDALASAYAEVGDFSAASDAANKALKLAEPQIPDYKTIQSRLELYKSSKPCRE